MYGTRTLTDKHLITKRTFSLSLSYHTVSPPRRIIEQQNIITWRTWFGGTREKNGMVTAASFDHLEFNSRDKIHSLLCSSHTHSHSLSSPLPASARAISSCLLAQQLNWSYGDASLFYHRTRSRPSLALSLSLLSRNDTLNGVVLSKWPLLRFVSLDWTSLGEWMNKLNSDIVLKWKDRARFDITPPIQTENLRVISANQATSQTT